MHVEPKARQQARQALRVRPRGNDPLHVRSIQQSVGHLLDSFLRDIPLFEEGFV
jgi:hypothetical protein